MKRILSITGGIALVVGMGIVVFWPINFWRLFDDNLRPLALTQAENYCAGFHGINNQFAYNDPDVATCIASGDYDNETPSVADSVMWGCQGIVAGGWPGSVNDCADIFERDQLWLLLNGGITLAWSEAYPRPKPIGQGALTPQSDSRTGSRDGFARGDQADATTTTTQGEETDAD